MSQQAVHAIEQMTAGRLFAAFWPDMILAAMLFSVAVFSAAPIVVALAVLCVLALIQAAWTGAIRHSATRQSHRHYEYGVGKLEQAVNLAIAVTMIFASLWLVNRVLGPASGTNGVTARRDLVLAAIAGAMFTLRHACLACTAMIDKPDATGQSAAGDAATGRGTLVLIIVTQLIVTAAALVRDQLFVSWTQSLGVLLIALALFVSGAGVFWTAVLDLVDHPLAPAEEENIIRLLGELEIDAERLHDMRARRAGSHLYVELTLAPDADQPFNETQKGFARLRRHLETRLGGADVVIKIA